MRKLSTLLLALLGFTSVSAQNLTLEKGDNIAFVGSGFADRQQHHGNFETLIHQAFPQHNIVVRNLGFSGDEVGVKPHRSDEVAGLDYFLNMKPGALTTTVGKTEVTYHAGAHFHANVIFAYWGFNESFAGPAGLDTFKTNLDGWLKKTLAADYGKGKVRVVLFSPIAHEDLKSPHFDAKLAAENNKNLALYAAAMAGVAKANGVQFVDLFAASQKLYASAKSPLTLNGIHVNAAGDAAFANREGGQHQRLPALPRHGLQPGPHRHGGAIAAQQLRHRPGTGRLGAGEDGGKTGLAQRLDRIVVEQFGQGPIGKQDLLVAEHKE